jgi:hypothetical protein
LDHDDEWDNIDAILNHQELMEDEKESEPLSAKALTK